MSSLITFLVSALLPWELTVLSTLVLLSFSVDLKFPFVFVISRFHPYYLILYKETYYWSSFCFRTLVSRHNLRWNFYFVIWVLMLILVDLLEMHLVLVQPRNLCWNGSFFSLVLICTEYFFVVDKSERRIYHICPNGRGRHYGRQSGCWTMNLFDLISISVSGFCDGLKN